MKDEAPVEGTVTLILGGARAGKSAFALSLAQEFSAANNSPVYFIATAQALDDEMRVRIARHRGERPTAWRTIEEPLLIDRALSATPPQSVAILDCFTLFVSNWLLKVENAEACEASLAEVAGRFLATAERDRRTVICVSNEVGLGLVPETALGRFYRDLLGKINQRVAEAASHVYFLTAGLPLRLKPPTYYADGRNA